MKRIFTLAMLMLAFDTHAQQVHKCVDRNGNVAYQSDPCSQVQTTARTWEARPDPVPDRPSLPVAAQRAPAGNVYLSTKTGRASKGRTTGASIPVENAGNSRACLTAKATRDRTLERVGLKRTFDLLRRLDEAVQRACK